MPAIKTDAQVSERLLSIDWGQQPSGRQAVAAPAPELRGKSVSVRIDEVFQNINAYRALVDAGIAADGMLARSLVSQANAIFNQAFVNLESRFGFTRVFVDAPLASEQRGAVDITELVIAEVVSLQNILNTNA
ncbi:MAG: hypothetical protein KF754_03595 [Planctomycetes bacterium]|nr:hypothetical protein [Planctomycetota bacterium]